MIVLDASAALELLLGGRLADRLAARMFDTPEIACAPHLLDVEVAQVLRRLVRRRELAAERAEQALDDLAALPLTRYPHQPLLSRVWQLRENATAYDACYLVLAEVLGAKLVTCDRALSLVPGSQADVEVIR